VLDLNIDQCRGPARLQRFGQGRNLAARQKSNFAKRWESELIDALGSADEPCQIVVVEHHNVARNTELNVKLDPVSAVGHGALECRQCVFGFMCTGATVGEEQRALATLWEKRPPSERLGGHRVSGL
jgi:hypothetical protein